jgi:hypothetical protein
MSATCVSCSSSLNDDDAFCGNCGYAVAVETVQSQPPDPPAAIPAGVPEQWSRQNAPPRPSWAGAAIPEFGPPGAAAFASARAAERPASPANGDGRIRVANPEDDAQSEAAAAAPESFITKDDRKLNYSDLGVSPTLDPLRNTRFLAQVARRWALYAVVTTVVDFVIFVLNLFLRLLGTGVGVLTLVSLLATLSAIVLFVLFWFLPVPALLGEWSRLLGMQAPAAPAVLDHVSAALERHCTPHSKLGVRPLSLPGEGRRQYLELRRTYFAGYVSCFAHGHDLYIGWTAWIYISPFRVLLMRWGRKFQDYTGRGNDMYQTLRWESAKATIAAIHTCTLEGVDAATGGRALPVPETVSV